MPEEFRDSIDPGARDAIPGAVDLGAATAGASAPEPERKPGKRRGRPPGSGKSAGTGKEKIKGAVDLSSLTGMFVGLHVMAASSLNVPELAMDMDEGTQFMKSAQNVLRHYSVETTQKTLDWIAFGGTCCMIYGTRFGAYMIRKRGEQEASRPAATVYQMPQRPQNNVQPAPQPEQHVPVEMDFSED